MACLRFAFPKCAVVSATALTPKGRCYLYHGLRRKRDVALGASIVNDSASGQDFTSAQQPLAAPPVGAILVREPISSPVSPKLGDGVSKPRRQPFDCGDLPFTIRRDGTWMYQGSPIGRKELVCLFASVLKREADGTFILETPAERGRIVVEDAPFLAVELDWTGDGHAQTLSFRTNVDQIVTAGPDNPIRVVHDPRTAEPTPYILVRPGRGQLGVEARINRAVYYELVALAEPEWIGDRQMLGVWSSGSFFALGDLPDEA